MPVSALYLAVTFFAVSDLDRSYIALSVAASVDVSSKLARSVDGRYV